MRTNRGTTTPIQPRPDARMMYVSLAWWKTNPSPAQQSLQVKASINRLQNIFEQRFISAHKKPMLLSGEIKIFFQLTLHTENWTLWTSHLSFGWNMTPLSLLDPVDTGDYVTHSLLASFSQHLMNIKVLKLYRIRKQDTLLKRQFPLHNNLNVKSYV